MKHTDFSVAKTIQRYPSTSSSLDEYDTIPNIINNSTNCDSLTLYNNISIFQYICKTYIPNETILKLYNINEPTICPPLINNIPNNIISTINYLILTSQSHDEIFNNLIYTNNNKYNTNLNTFFNILPTNIKSFTLNLIHSIINQLIYSFSYNTNINKYCSIHNISTNNIFTYLISHSTLTSISTFQYSHLISNILFGPNTGNEYHNSFNIPPHSSFNFFFIKKSKDFLYINFTKLSSNLNHLSNQQFSSIPPLFI